VYSPAITDFIIMVKGTSYMFVTGPDVVRTVTHEQVTKEELGGAMTHNERSGVAHFAVDDDQAAILLIRELLSFMPANNVDDPPRREPADPPANADEVLESIVPGLAESAVQHDRRDRPRRGRWVSAAGAGALSPGISSSGSRAWQVAPSGIVANQPAHLAGTLDIDAAVKGARFVRFCDAFNIPLVTFEDVPGFLPGTGQEYGGVIRHGAKLLFAFAEATVPKVTVITRKAYGGAYCVMSSKHIAPTANFAWPTAEIARDGRLKVR
jgi:propionyl-CoA carboxylase beta chain